MDVIKNAFGKSWVHKFMKNNHHDKLLISGNTVDELEPCFTCDGTGEIHSHNPKCFSCGGKGEVTLEKNKELKESYRILNSIIPKWTGDYE